MKRNLIAGVLVISAGIAIAGAIMVSPARAQERTKPNIQFPVAALGSCESEQACKRYCDDPAHVETCLAFAEQHGLMSREEAAAARQFTRDTFKGPGGCTSREACETYCDDVSHINECVTFAEVHGIVSPKELEEAKRVQQALAQGVQPPACSSRRACETYCRAPEHLRECIAFGEAAGFLKGRELEDAKKVVGAIDRGITPPPCGGREACNAYCAEEAHFTQCLAFAEAAGFITPEDAVRARKTGGKGPGECRGREECETFCQDPSHQEECFAFAKERGLIPEGELHRIEEGRTKFREGLEQAPPEIAECLKATVGEEVLAKIERGEGFPPRDLGEKMRGCFEKLGPRPSESSREGGPPRGEFRGGTPREGRAGFSAPPGEFRGPGGCTSPEECRTYCEKNPEACGGFGPREEEGFRESGPRPDFLEGRGGLPGGGEMSRPGQVPRREGPPTSGEHAPYGMMREGGFRPPGGTEQVPIVGCKTPEECAQLKSRIPEEFRAKMERGVPSMPYPRPTGSEGEGFEGRVPFPQNMPPQGYEGGPGTGQRYPMMGPIPQVRPAEGGLPPTLPPQEFQGVLPPPPQQFESPRPSSFSPHMLLGLLFGIVTGRW